MTPGLLREDGLPRPFRRPTDRAFAPGPGDGHLRRPRYLLPVDLHTFDYENLHLRVDRGVFELFHLNSIANGLRVPLPWLGVLVHYKKSDKPGELTLGVVRDPGAALYGTDQEAFRYRHTLAERIPLTDEPLFRAFFTEVAALVDRRVV